MMILTLTLLLLNFLNETNAGTVAITECHNGGSTMDMVPQGQIPRRPVPSATACRDSDQNLCNALFPLNNDHANNADP